jgi:MFS family permease
VQTFKYDEGSGGIQGLHSTYPQSIAALLTSTTRPNGLCAEHRGLGGELSILSVTRSPPSEHAPRHSLLHPSSATVWGVEHLSVSAQLSWLPASPSNAPRKAYGNSFLPAASVRSRTFSMSFHSNQCLSVGFGLNIALNAAPLLVTELAYPTQRAQITAMYNCIWYLGSVIAAWACYGAYKQREGNWAWRIPSLVQAGPSVLQMFLVWFIPESPRWLIAKGRIEEARKILSKYHANNDDARDPLVAFEVTQIQHALRMEKDISKNTTYLTLFQTPGNRRRMRIVVALALFSQWR